MSHNMHSIQFDEKRLIFLLNNLNRNQNVECVLEELSTMKIPKTVAKQLSVVDQISKYVDVPGLEKLVAIIMETNSTNFKKVSFVNNKCVKKESDDFSTATSQLGSNSSTFPLKFGPGLNHGNASPFQTFAQNGKSPGSSYEVLNHAYFQQLYHKVTMESTALRETSNPTVDQVLEDMNQMNGASFILRFGTQNSDT